MSEVELTVKGDIEVLRLQPDDVIVISVDRHIDPGHAAHLKAEAEILFPGRTIAILTRGIRLSAKREEVAA